MVNRCFFLIFCICISLNLYSCSCNKGTSEDPPVEETPPPKKDDMPDLVPTPTSSGKIKITLKNVRINADDDEWLDQLGIGKTEGKAAVVNSLHPRSMMGEGIDFELSMWAMANGINTSWNNNPNVIFFKKYESSREGLMNLNASFSGINVPFGCIFLVDGPLPMNTIGLEESSKAIEDLYYDILKSTPRTIRKIVLCAVSTGKLAADGTTIGTHKPFTKAQWIRHIYNGIHKGINRYKTDFPNRPLEIVLNN